MYNNQFVYLLILLFIYLNLLILYIFLPHFLINNFYVYFQQEIKNKNQFISKYLIHYFLLQIYRNLFILILNNTIQYILSK